MPYIHILGVILLTYVGVVSLSLTAIPNWWKIHGWIERVLLPPAISIVAMLCATLLVWATLMGVLIFRSFQ